ncbi:MAG: hypothetical protein WD599_05545 [Balneolaceae bacterium]
MKKVLTVLILSILFTNCTSSKWTVIDLHAIDERDPPVKTDSTFTVVIGHKPTHDNPIFNLQVREIEELEYTQRVWVERTVQQYRPKWGFTLLSLAGAGLSIYAGNTDTFINTRSNTQSMALNVTGAILTTLAFTNLKPVGEPIRTGETKFLRKNGTVIKTDTVAVKNESEFTIDLSVTYGDQEILSGESYFTQSKEININIANLLQDETLSSESPGSLIVEFSFQEVHHNYEIPVASFLEPFLHITVPIAELRSQPTTDSRSLLTEIGQGSELTFLRNYDEHWYEVQVGGTNSFVARENGEIRWQAVDNGDGPSVITVEDVPFGEISIENSVPVLRRSESSDRAFILSNHQSNNIGSRPYLERDYQLIDLYFRNAFDLNRDQIVEINITGEESIWEDPIDSPGLDSLATVFVYIGGFAVVDNSNGREVVKMIKINEEGKIRTVLLEDVLLKIAEKSRQKLIIFVDLEFQPTMNENRSSRSVNRGGDIVWLQLANRITRVQPNSALIFSSGTHQLSGLYSSDQSENMYHHIFPYYLAQGIQHRRTKIIELVQYLENQVDYTSRRLFDRPQEIHAFGNLTINLAGDN